LMLSAGVNYQILENLAVDASYNYSTLMSDDAVREFQRNNVSLGLTASF
jgi:opacity protein-like surface antigen